MQERRLFLALVGMLLAIGVLMVHSASITSRPTTFEQVYLSRHLVFVILGIAAGMAAAWISPSTWRRLAPWLFVGTLCLLGLVLVPGIGTRVNGSQRWLRYGIATMQPSEVAKVTLPLCLCWLMEVRKKWLRTWLVGPAFFVIPIMLVVPLVLLQPDLGTSLFLVTGGALALFLGGWPIRNFLTGLAVTLPGVGYLILQQPYQLKRITGFLAAWSDWSEAPYQLRQSLVTMGAGGTWGVGLGKGWQKLSFLPEANTDFVFAVIGEELGLVGTLGVIGLWGGLFLVGYRLLHPLRRDSFEYVAGLTLLTQFVGQAGLNIAVVTALVPPKGISHPLISYGGSNLVMSLVLLGILMSLTRKVPKPVLKSHEAMQRPHFRPQAATEPQTVRHLKG